MIGREGATFRDTDRGELNLLPSTAGTGGRSAGPGYPRDRVHASESQAREDTTELGRPSWSSDGRWLAVTTGTVKAGQLELINIGTKQRYRLLKGRQLGDTAWIAPDRVAVASGIYANSPVAAQRREAKPKGILVVRLPRLPR